MPGKPDEQDQGADTEPGRLSSRLFTLPTNEVVYIIKYSDLLNPISGPNAIKSALDNGRDQATEGSHGKLVSETLITLAGYPERDLKVLLPNQDMIRSRIYLVEKRFYQTIVITLAKEIDSVAATKFLDSFRLKPKR